MSVKKQTDLYKVKEMACSFLYMPIQETKFSPMFIDHPIFESAYGVLDNGSMINILESEENLEKYRRECKQRILKEIDVMGIVILIRKPYRLAFYKYCYDYLSKADKSDLLREIYVLSENPNIDVNVTIKQLIKWFKAADKKILMDKEDFEVYINFPNEVTCYRGVGRLSNPNGISYTLSLDKAKWFAKRFKDTDGYVTTLKVPKKYILAYFSDRGEDEVIVDVVGLKKNNQGSN